MQKVVDCRSGTQFFFDQWSIDVTFYKLYETYLWIHIYYTRSSYILWISIDIQTDTARNQVVCAVHVRIRLAVSARWKLTTSLMTWNNFIPDTITSFTLILLFCYPFDQIMICIFFLHLRVLKKFSLFYILRCRTVLYKYRLVEKKCLQIISFGAYEYMLKISNNAWNIQSSYIRGLLLNERNIRCNIIQ